MNSAQLERARQDMVQTQLMRRGISDSRVLQAMLRMPRHLFVSPDQAELAYTDRALAIGNDQTISQPYIVALMLQALELKGTERVLDVGTGSGYLAALLGMLAREVISIERIPELADIAKQRMAQLEITNVRVVMGDGLLGYAPGGPFEAIVVSAAHQTIPPALIEQLSEGGRLVIPIGESDEQKLLALQKTGDELTQKHLCNCRFVPLLPSIAAAN